MKEKDWYVYIIRATDNTLYTGIATDVLRRWKEHSTSKGAKYFRGREPKEIYYVESCFTRSDASKRECQIKRLSRREKLLLADSEQNIAKLYTSKLGIE